MASTVVVVVSILICRQPRVMQRDGVRRGRHPGRGYRRPSPALVKAGMTGAVRQ